MLICAGWLPQDGLFGWGFLACLRSSVYEVVVAHRCSAGCSSRCSSVVVGIQVLWAVLFQDCEGPAPAGEFTSDSGGGDGELFVPRRIVEPAFVQAPVAGVGPDADVLWRKIPTGLQGGSDLVGGLVMPCGLDQESTHVSVAGLGDRAQAAATAGGVLGRHQARYAPMLAPVNRCQSPISTASAKPVSVEIPRRQASRRVMSVNSESAAIAAMAVSSR